MDSGWPYRSEMVTHPSRGRLGAVGGNAAPARLGVLVLVASGLALLSGCVAQQADLKQTERELQRKNQAADGGAGSDQGPSKPGNRVAARAGHSVPARRCRKGASTEHKAWMRGRMTCWPNWPLRIRRSNQRTRRKPRSASLEESKRLGWVEKQLVDQDALLKGERDRNRAEFAVGDGSVGSSHRSHGRHSEKRPGCHAEDHDGARAKSRFASG
jgi:hypothetical protein